MSAAAAASDTTCVQQLPGPMVNAMDAIKHNMQDSDVLMTINYALTWYIEKVAAYVDCESHEAFDGSIFQISHMFTPEVCVFCEHALVYIKTHSISRNQKQLGIADICIAKINLLNALNTCATAYMQAHAD